ncbi:MAG: LEA type 2 family protein [Bacteroidetes bacterium]|jgi:LEA14-like dessication related protein|nr:LEA type 2 family protein [Bacteroidota bacterium]
MKTSKRFVSPVIMLFLLLTLNSCTMLDQINQVQQLALCEFNVLGVNEVSIAGIELQENMERDDLNAAQIMQLTAAVFRREMIVDFNLLLDIDNPNNKTAAMNRMDYELFIDNKEILTGQMNQPVNVGPNASAQLPMPIRLDLFKVLNNETQDALVNLAFKLTGDQSNPSEILLKVKPYIKVGGRELAYPGFLSVRHTLK